MTVRAFINREDPTKIDLHNKIDPRHHIRCRRSRRDPGIDAAKSRGDAGAMTKVLDTIGTLQLIDTGRRCSVRNVRILRVHCTAGCGSDDLLHDTIVDPYWSMIKTLDGYHQGCDPDSTWRKDPVGSKLRHDAGKSLLDKRASGACIACDQFDCTGAEILISDKLAR